MALEARLRAAFRGDGTFDLAASLTVLEHTLATADFGEARFDPSAVLDLLAGLAPPDLAAAVRASSEVGARIGGSLGSPGANVPTSALLDPVQRLVQPLAGLGFETLDGLGDPVGTDLGLAGLQARIARVTAALEDSPLNAAADLLTGAAGGVSLPDAAGAIGPVLDGTVNLAALVGALLAVETTSGTLAARSAALRGMLGGPALAAGERLRALTAYTGLAARIRATAPADGPATELLGREMVAFLDAVAVVADEWTRALGFGEAALVGLDLDGAGGALAAARAVLDVGRVESVARMALGLRSGLDGLLRLELPDPAASLEQALADAFALVGQLVELVRGVDAAELVAPVTAVLDTALAPVRELAEAVGSVGAAVESAIRAVEGLVRAIDLTSVTQAIEAALAPVVSAMAAISQLIEAGQAAIETVAGRVTGILRGISDEVARIAGLIRAALGRVSTAVAAIDFATVQTTVESGIGTVVHALDAAQLSPYFDASIEVIDTTASVVGAIPFGMLPADLQSEIVAACRPVREIDFQAIADGLAAELDAILAGLDTDVLAEVDAAYEAVVAFLASIDPRDAITAFESGPYEDFRRGVLAVDPSALFEPVAAALDGFRSLLAEVDLTTEVLGPLEQGFATLRDRLAELDPATLLAQAQQQLDAARADIAAALRLDLWGSGAALVRGAVDGFLGRLEPAGLAATLSAEVAERLRSGIGEPPGVVGTLAAGLAQAGGLPAEATSLPEVLTWFRGTSGQAVVQGRLLAVAGDLAATRDAVRALDPGPLLAAAQAHHRALLEAARSHPEGSSLRLALEPLLAANPPGDLLGRLGPNRARYLARLEADARVAAELSATGFSQITVTTDGLRDALVPLGSVLVWARTLLERLGLATEGGPLGALLAVWLEHLGPDRVVPPLVELIEAIRDKVGELAEAALEPVEVAAAATAGALAVLDLGPIVEGAQAVHAQALADLDRLSPAALLGPALAAVDDVAGRLEAFDPLAPVQVVIDTLRAAVTTAFETARPTVLFADAIAIYAAVVEATAGLDVRALLDPVLAALAGLAVQLDTGLDEVAVALARLQDALPDRVTDSGPSGSVTVDVGVSV